MPAVAATLAAVYRLTDSRGRMSFCLRQNMAQLQGLTDWSVWLSHYCYHNSYKIPAQSHSIVHFTSSEQLKLFYLNRESENSTQIRVERRLWLKVHQPFVN